MTELVIFIRFFGDRCPGYKKQIGTNWTLLLASWQEGASMAGSGRLCINRKGKPVPAMAKLLGSSCLFGFACFKNKRDANFHRYSSIMGASTRILGPRESPSMIVYL